jgi:hypothetical protein
MSTPTENIAFKEFFAEAMDDLLADYKAAVKLSGLAPKSQDTYINHAEQFVHWLRGDFHPGERLR